MQLAPLAESRPHLENVWARHLSALDGDLPPAISNARPSGTSGGFLSSSGVAAVIAFVVGTGGLLTAAYVAERNDRGYRLTDFNYEAAASTASGYRFRVRSPVENLARLRNVFDISITAVASLFNVSRQTIYNWQAGHHIAETNEERLKQLADVADLLEAEGLANSPTVLRRKLYSGLSFIDLVRQGSPVDDAARSMVTMIRLEHAQRAALSARLARRTRGPVDLDAIGSQRINESI